MVFAGRSPRLRAVRPGDQWADGGCMAGQPRDVSPLLPNSGLFGFSARLVLPRSLSRAAGENPTEQSADHWVRIIGSLSEASVSREIEHDCELEHEQEDQARATDSLAASHAPILQLELDSLGQKKAR